MIFQSDFLGGLTQARTLTYCLRVAFSNVQAWADSHPWCFQKLGSKSFTKVASGYPRHIGGDLYEVDTEAVWATLRHPFDKDCAIFYFKTIGDLRAFAAKHGSKLKIVALPPYASPYPTPEPRAATVNEITALEKLKVLGNGPRAQLRRAECELILAAAKIYGWSEENG